MNKKHIGNFTLKEFESEISKMKEPSYRARQIFSGFYKKGARSFSEIKNLPMDFIERLNSRYYMNLLDLSEIFTSKDGTEKFLFRLEDGHFIEAVLIPSRQRKTLCVSTQVGCKFACPFCVSGRRGFVRNLTPSEIVGQVLYVRQRSCPMTTNYVFMGMGEPLDNYENTVKAILIMNEKEGLGIGARRVTVSTCGIIPGIKKLADLGLQINLSLSLHATNNKLRDELVPINKRYRLEDLIKACEEYTRKTGRIITLEYILIKNKNHSPQDAEKLAEIAKKLRANVNLLPCSENQGFFCCAPSQREMGLFMKHLIKRGVRVTLRKSKGQDIRAACGQLAGRI